ncbi:hypothetical protein [Paraburkholderia sp. HP33-1]|nr:hypothetical protein [Paraburkholderia sp. HP33-1]
MNGRELITATMRSSISTRDQHFAPNSSKNRRCHGNRQSTRKSLPNG